MRVAVVGWANQPPTPAKMFELGARIGDLPGNESRIYVNKVVTPLQAKHLQKVEQPFIFRVFFELLKFKPDFVIDVDRSGALIAFCLLLGIPVVQHRFHYPFSQFREARKNPNITTFEGLPYNAQEDAEFRKYFRFDSFGQHLTIAPNEFVKRAHLEEYPHLDEERMLVLPHALDFRHLFKPADKPRAGPQRVLFVADDVQLKGLEETIQAFRLLRKQFPDLKLRVVSRGVVACEEPGVELDKVWRPEFYQRMPQQFQESDVFVLPTRTDAMPISALEALACGIPVVISRGVGYDDRLVPGRSGAFIDPRDPQDIAEKILPFLRQTAKQREATRKACLEAVEDLQSHLTAPLLAAQLEAVKGKLSWGERVEGLAWLFRMYVGHTVPARGD